jgi:hypothetical protein
LKAAEKANSVAFAQETWECVRSGKANPRAKEKQP